MTRVLKLVVGLALVGVGLGRAAHGLERGDGTATLAAFASLLGGCAFILGAMWPAPGPNS